MVYAVTMRECKLSAAQTNPEALTQAQLVSTKYHLINPETVTQEFV